MRAVALACITTTAAAASLFDVSAQCSHAAITAPACLHNSTLYAYRGDPNKNSDAEVDNCASCVCALPDQDEFAARQGESYAPSWGACCDGWAGTDCGVCETDAACGAGSRCAAGSLVPTAAELEAGKRYSCAPCGYGASNGFCLYADLPSVSFDMVLRGATADVAMRIGRDQRPMVEGFDDVREIWAGRRGRRRSDRSREKRRIIGRPLHGHGRQVRDAARVPVRADVRRRARRLRGLRGALRVGPRRGLRDRALRVGRRRLPALGPRRVPGPRLRPLQVQVRLRGRLRRGPASYFDKVSGRKRSSLRRERPSVAGNSEHRSTSSTAAASRATATTTTCAGGRATARGSASAAPAPRATSAKPRRSSGTAPRRRCPARRRPSRACPPARGAAT